MAEAAFAFVPGGVPAGTVSRDTAEVLAFARQYAATYPEQGRAVFFSDLTRALALKDTSWEAAGIDWEAVIAEVSADNAPFPTLFLTLSQRAHVIVGDASRAGIVLHYPDGSSEQVSAQERQAVHDAIAQQLQADWSSYITSLADRGLLRPS